MIFLVPSLYGTSQYSNFKRILNKETDKESILKSVKANRQRIQTAKAEWEKESGRSVSLSTLKVFLKALTDDTNE